MIKNFVVFLLFYVDCDLDTTRIKSGKTLKFFEQPINFTNPKRKIV